MLRSFCLILIGLVEITPFNHNQYYFSDFDVNGDGAILRNEANDHRILFAQFDVLDINNDGEIILDELQPFLHYVKY